MSDLLQTATLHQTVVVDGSAARVGGGVSRLRELARSFTVLAPHHRYLFVASERVGATIDDLPPRGGMITVPSQWTSVPLRLLWEHFVLPLKLRSSQPEWLLGPHNVLPLGPSGGWHPRRALIVSNIAPFVPESLVGASGYQAQRIRSLRWLTLSSLRRADLVMFLSRFAADMLSEYTTASTRILSTSPPHPEVLNAAQDAQLPPSAERDDFFLLVGDLMRHKRVKDAVEAVSNLVRDGFKARLIVCGNEVDPKYGAEVRALIDSLPDGSVDLVGGLSHEETLSLMRASMATVSCSAVENPGRVFTEALSMGAPLISTRIPSAVEICGDAAIYYEPGDIDALTHAMFRIYRDDAIRSRMSEAGRVRSDGFDHLSSSRDILIAMELL